ncbi:peptidase M15 [Vibrio phage 1.081.O._10N.286.52.C2]|nr:peptidase M15 [Vibrio phage 1.081.O._10N.286.52.C2]
MYKCKHFKIQEIVTPQMYAAWGDRCWSLFDERLLITLDALRERFGSCTINDWMWGGNFKYSGMRDEHFYSSVQAYLNSRSQHKYGRAADCKFSAIVAAEVRAYILENPSEFPHVKFIETGPLANGKTMTWVHIDVRNGDVTCWSPVEGVISASEVIRRKL